MRVNLFISEGLTNQSTLTFGEIEMGNCAIEIDDEQTTINLYCSPIQAERMALELLDSINKYKNKYPYKFQKLTAEEMKESMEFKRKSWERE